MKKGTRVRREGKGNLRRRQVNGGRGYPLVL